MVDPALLHRLGGFAARGGGGGDSRGHYRADRPLSRSAHLSRVYVDGRHLRRSRPAHPGSDRARPPRGLRLQGCLLYTSDAADDLLCVDLGGRRIIKKKKKKKKYIQNK